MPSPYFQNYQTAVESSLVEDLYNEAIYMQGFGGYYIPNTNSGARDLIYGDDPLKHFDDAFLLDMYLVNTMDYGDEQDFFSKFGLEVRNQIKIQFTVREFLALTLNEFSRPLEGDLIFIPFMKDSGELFEIKFVNTSKDLYTLGRIKPYYYELSLEPFKYNDESFDTGIDVIDSIEILEAFKTTLDFQIGSGNFIVGEHIYQGTANSHIASAEVSQWNAANTLLTVINVSGKFDTTSELTVLGSVSDANYYLYIADNRLESQFDNTPLSNEASQFVQPDDNPFGSLSSF
jgi:hypothetical protein